MKLPLNSPVRNDLGQARLKSRRMRYLRILPAGSLFLLLELRKKYVINVLANLNKQRETVNHGG